MDENKVIEFKEELNLEDLQKANFYNFKKHKKYLINQIIFVVMSILLIGVSIADKEWVFLGIGVILLIFATVFFVPLYKKMIYNAVKKGLKENIKIKLGFDNEGFMYELEEKEECPKYEYNQAIKVYSVKGYIYMYFNNSSIAIIKKEACNEIEQLEEILKEKYQEKYIIDEKTSF